MSAPDPELATLLSTIGVTAPATATAIGGTGNNAVFRVEAGGRTFVLKRYFQHPGDPRDRFATERAFATFLWQAGLRHSPEPLAWSAEHRLGLFECIAGVRSTEPTPALVEAAVRFFNDTNAHRFSEAAHALPIASEACFSVREHLDRVERRVARLQGIVPGSDLDEQAAVLVREKLAPAWQRVHGAIAEDAALDRVLEPRERCLSPSDFGFHNALVTPDGRVRFLDFEYAGWDDPAKTVCDFFCQPAVPVPIAHLEAFRSGLAGFDSPGFRARVAQLLPVYRLKWCCILLNEFLPADSGRRTFSDPGHDHSARKCAQLEKALHALGAIEK